MLTPGGLRKETSYDPLLPRPMAIYRVLAGADADESCEVEIRYKLVGRGTRLLAEKAPGEPIGVVGPLGQGFPLPEAGCGAILLAGGTGVASVYELAARSGAGATILIGARSAEDLGDLADFEALSGALRIATEDGSRGHRGLVTELLAPALAGDLQSEVYVCGPTPMMRAAAKIAAAQGRRCWVSLENPMACGFGVCLGCAAPRSDGGFSLVCRDGPVFEAGEVDWERLA
jgi:dihydroorotate dehydrogenase electron transfer subunit